MRSIVHRELGDPAQVLRLEQTPVPALGPKQILVRTSYAPIHPGDLLGVKGSPAAGTPPAIGSDGRVPGFEGAGVVTEVGRGVDPASGIKPGARVAFFPAGSTWSEQVVVPAGSIVLLPEDVSDVVGAQMLINTVTALTALRAAHDSLPLDAREDVVVIVTAAGSAVGRLIVKLLMERGVFPIRLVRSEAGAAALANLFPGSPVFATETDGWTERVRAAAGGRPIHVAIGCGARPNSARGTWRLLSASLPSQWACSMSPVTTGLLEFPKRSLMLVSRARSAPRCSTSPKTGKANEDRNYRSRRGRPCVCARSHRTRA